mgnify:CR=1 FL=1
MAGTLEYELLNKNLEMVDGHAVKAPEDYQNPEQLYEALIARVRKYHPSADISLIERRISFPERHIKSRSASPESLISFIRSGWGSFWRIWRWIRRRSWQECSMIRLKIQR